MTDLFYIIAVKRCKEDIDKLVKERQNIESTFYCSDYLDVVDEVDFILNKELLLAKNNAQRVSTLERFFFETLDCYNLYLKEQEEINKGKERSEKTVRKTILSYAEGLEMNRRTLKDTQAKIEIVTKKKPPGIIERIKSHVTKYFRK